jgi:hypothetical protein
VLAISFPKVSPREFGKPWRLDEWANDSGGWGGLFGTSSSKYAFADHKASHKTIPAAIFIYYS